jgi:hypothetical protein
MNVKFKKLAMQAGITAALAGASLSAHAVITAVPAPAQLIPLFMHTDTLDTEVRVIAPRAVGADTVIDLLGGESVGTQASWNGTQTGLSTSSTSTTSLIHWFFMDKNSNEIVNSNFRVTPDDEVYFSAASLCNGVAGPAASCGGTNTAQSLIPPNTPGYLIMVNESAYLGGAPTFSFSAEAWVANEGTPTNGLASAIVIPVLGMADTADTTTYPTPSNNVIENYAPAGAGGPIASPIHTGMRTSATLQGANYRVFDIPMYPVVANGYGNMIVAWADRNYAAAIANPPSPEIKNGLSGRLFTVNNQEVQTSNGRLTLPNQLNIVPAVPPAYISQLGPYVPLYTSVLSNATFSALGNGGFLKFVVDTVDLPVDWTDQGAYSSVVIFNVPVSLSGTAVDTGYADDNAELAIDTGFFSAN